MAKSVFARSATPLPAHKTLTFAPFQGSEHFTNVWICQEGCLHAFQNAVTYCIGPSAVPADETVRFPTVAAVSMHIFGRKAPCFGQFQRRLT
jgi:hypothetical protein